MSNTDRNTKIAFAFAMLTLLLMGAVSYRSLVVSEESDRWVRHTHEVLENIKGLQFDLATVDSNRRGYLLTDYESTLEAYRASLLKVKQDQATLLSLTADNPIQQQRLAALSPLIDTKIESMEPILALRRADGVDAAVATIQSGQGRVLTAQVQAAAAKLQDEELRLLDQRTAEVKRRLV